MQIKWRGFVASVSEKEGGYWVFVCTECKNNLRYRSEYDTVFKLAYELAAGLNIEQEISFGGKIAKIQYPRLRVLLNNANLN